MCFLIYSSDTKVWPMLYFLFFFFFAYPGCGLRAGFQKGCRYSSLLLWESILSPPWVQSLEMASPFCDNYLMVLIWIASSSGPCVGDLVPPMVECQEENILCHDSQSQYYHQHILRTRRQVHYGQTPLKPWVHVNLSCCKLLIPDILFTSVKKIIEHSKDGKLHQKNPAK